MPAGAGALEDVAEAVLLLLSFALAAAAEPEAFLVWQTLGPGVWRTTWIEADSGLARTRAERPGIAVAAGAHLVEWRLDTGPLPDLDCPCVNAAGNPTEPPAACRTTTVQPLGFSVVIDGAPHPAMQRDSTGAALSVKKGLRPDVRYDVLGSGGRLLLAIEDAGSVSCATGARTFHTDIRVQVLDAVVTAGQPLPVVLVPRSLAEQVDAALCPGESCTFPQEDADWNRALRSPAELVAVAPTWAGGVLHWSGWFAVPVPQEKASGGWSSYRRSGVFPVPAPRWPVLEDPPGWVGGWIREHPGVGGVHRVEVDGAEREELFARFAGG